jgi:hypothetical protein
MFYTFGPCDIMNRSLGIHFLRNSEKISSIRNGTKSLSCAVTGNIRKSCTCLQSDPLLSTGKFAPWCIGNFFDASGVRVRLHIVLQAQHSTSFPNVRNGVVGRKAKSWHRDLNNSGALGYTGTAFSRPYGYILAHSFECTDCLDNAETSLTPLYIH